MFLRKTKALLNSKLTIISAIIMFFIPLVFIGIKINFPRGAIVSRFVFLLCVILGMTGTCVLPRNKIAQKTLCVISTIELFFILLLHCLELYNYSMQEDFFNYEFYISMLDISLLIEQLPYNINYLLLGLLYIFIILSLFVFLVKTSETSKSNKIIIALSTTVILFLFCINSTCIGCFARMIIYANQSTTNNADGQSIDYAFYEKLGISTSNVGHDNFIINSEGIGKNLVFIILESFENNFLDEELFPGLAPNLNRLRKDKRTINFSNMGQFANNTAVSMFQAFWGFPIVPAIAGTSAYSSINCKALDKFVSLPYIFKKDGYSWEHVQSSGMAYNSQSLINEGVSLDYLKKMNLETGYKVVQDRIVFDYAWKLYQSKIENGDNRFVISISTMDSHGPNGRVFEDTLEYPNKDFFPDDYEYLPLLNATYTTDYYLGQFVDNILNSELGKNTIISIMNDHRFMGNAAGVLSKKERKNVFMIINADNGREISEKGCQIDVAPTIVDYFQIESNYKFPLGVSLLSNKDTKDYDLRTLKKGNKKDFIQYITLRSLGNTIKTSTCYFNKDNSGMFNAFGTSIPTSMTNDKSGMMYITLSDDLVVEDHEDITGRTVNYQIEHISELLNNNKKSIILFQTNKCYEAEELLFKRLQIPDHSSAYMIGKYGMVYLGKDGKIISPFLMTFIILCLILNHGIVLRISHS